MDDISSLGSITRLSKLKDDVILYLESHLESLDFFMKRSVSTDEDLTALGFSLFYISSLSERYTAYNQKYEDIISTYYPKLLNKSKEVHEAEKVTKTGPLPNSYNTSIQLAGILKAHHYLFRNEKDNICNILSESNMIEEYVKKVSHQVEERGFVTRLEDDSTPSPYLTYWFLESLILLNAKENKASVILDKIKNWSLNSLYKLISCNFAKIEYAVDSIEMCYLILILQRLLKDEQSQTSRSLEIKNIIDHSITLLFSRYFQQGCFIKSQPVFATRKGFSLICSTVEPLALLLIQANDWVCEHEGYFCQVFDFLKKNEIDVTEDGKIKSWRSEWEHASSKSTLFLTTAVITFLNAFIRSVSQKMLNISRSELVVRKLNRSDRFQADENFNSYFKYGDISVRLKNVCNKIANTDRHIVVIRCSSSIMRDTTVNFIAKSTELEIVFLDLGILLAKGLSNLEAEIEPFFIYLTYMDRVLIYIDKMDVLEKKQGYEGSGLQVLISSIYFRIQELCKQSNCIIIIGEEGKTNSSTKLVQEGYTYSIESIAPLGKANAKKEFNDACKQQKISDKIPNAIFENEDVLVSDILAGCFIPDINLIADRLVELIDIYALEQKNDDEIYEVISRELMEYEQIRG
jgi:hypothetical protein